MAAQAHVGACICWPAVPVTHRAQWKMGPRQEPACAFRPGGAATLPPDPERRILPPFPPGAGQVGRLFSTRVSPSAGTARFPA
jgi:hypothetical protein